MTGKAENLVRALALLLAAAWQGNALAATSTQSWDVAPPQTVVHFGDLDLKRPADAAVLYRRIKSSAERVCGEPRLTGSFTIRGEWRSCVAQAIERAVTSVDRPTLTAYYRLHTTPYFRQSALAQR